MGHTPLETSTPNSQTEEIYQRFCDYVRDRKIEVRTAKALDNPERGPSVSFPSDLDYLPYIRPDGTGACDAVMVDQIYCLADDGRPKHLVLKIAKHRYGMSNDPAVEQEQSDNPHQ